MDPKEQKCQCENTNSTKSAGYLFYDNKGLGVGAPQPMSQPISQTPAQIPEGTMSLHFALGSLKKPELETLVKQNPASVHEKGFNGQSPLHKAVLGSDIEVIDLLLRYHADPNATNSFNETPFHFACKRGLPSIINLLIENGADINFVDKAGKGAVHHAAHGGSVHGLFYLGEVHGLGTHIRDLNLSTPLHVVAAHGHVEALNYLLRKDRCDLLAQNAHANNALHIAANAGHGWTCWKILEHGGLELLHQKNREGNTPLDLAKKKHSDPKFRETVTLLTYYTLSGKQKGRASGPVFAWYAHGLLPGAAYPVVLLVASWTGRVGLVSCIGLLLLVLLLYQHTHRIQHISRWPNPIYFGMFLAGVVHSTICYYVEVLPYIYGDHGAIVTIMILWNCAFVYMYYRLLTIDPGVAKEPAQKPGSLWSYSIRDIADGSLRPEAFCTHCELIPPKLTHHCKLCLACYLNTDHHCLFLYRCIARNNHRLFIVFCSAVVVGMLMFLYTLCLYFELHYRGKHMDWQLFQEIYNARPWASSVFIANAISVFWGVNLVRFQLLIVSKGQTTVYQPNGGRTTLNRKQRLYNVMYFLAGRGYYVTESEMTV